MSGEICCENNSIKTCAPIHRVPYCARELHTDHWPQFEFSRPSSPSTDHPFSELSHCYEHSSPNFSPITPSLQFSTQQSSMSNSSVYVSLPQPEQIVTSQYCTPDSSSPEPYPSETSSCDSDDVDTSTFITQRSFLLNNLRRYCQIILNDMRQYGFCVIDDFLQNGGQILAEVEHLYDNGVFRDGQVVNNRVNTNTKQIRGDQIVWVDGSEPPCSNIGFLIRILDSLIAGCNASGVGEFEKYKIRRRTKAMLACYPGNYSKYVRHVDNPNGDGRCITSIYYLNKNYDRLKDGGVLRLFPQMNKSIVADIEPKFNRVIFFWSDRRNPHEVMPSARVRFAITVWFFDDNERAKAIEKYREKNLKCPSDKDLMPLDTYYNSL